MRIDMFVYNRCTTDARVLKEAGSLAAAGHDVRIVAVLDDTTETAERRDGFRIVRIDRNPIHYRALRLLRSTTWALRRGAGASAGAIGRSRPRPRGYSAALLAPLYLLELAGRAMLRAGFAATRVAERIARRTLLLPHKPLMFFDYYRRAYRLVREDPPDAVHAHDLNTLPVAAALAGRFGLRLVYDSHELYPEISTLSTREAAVWRFLEIRLAPRADEVITVCESIAGELTDRYGVAPPTVLLNCPPSEDGGADSSLLRRYVGVPEPEPIVLYQGGFARNRGLETLIRASRELDRGKLVLMGWGELEDALRELIAVEGLNEKILIVPPVSPTEVVAHAAGATVGVIPYEPVGLNNRYTTPNKMFDYIAAGLPIVAIELPELVRFLEGGGLGVTFPAGDQGALSESLNQVLADAQLRAGMRANAARAATLYTWEREAEKLTELYATGLSRPRGAGPRVRFPAARRR
jgi:glycosyltransferase involved in cell wall biosynthesis